MKKILVILLSFALLFSLSACGNNETMTADGASNGSGDAASTGDAANNTDKITSDVKIQIIPQNPMAQGERIVSISDNLGFVDAETDLPETFPIYVNDYVYGQEGPLYDVTDEVKSTISFNLSRFLGFLYDDFSADEAEYSSDSGREYEIYYVNNSTEVRSSINSISIITSDYDIPYGIKAKELLENEVVKAAIAYLEIKNPVVTSTVEYRADGTEDMIIYKVLGKTSSAFGNAINNSFSSITVINYKDLDSTIVQIRYIYFDGLTEYAQHPDISYLDAVAALSTYYPEMDKSDIKTEIYYNASVKPGYFFPCYRFYIKDGVLTQSGDDRYTVVDVLLTDDSVDK